MKSIKEGKKLSEEMAEWLRNTDEKQKILIRGIMIGADLERGTREEKAG